MEIYLRNLMILIIKKVVINFTTHLISFNHT